MLRATAEPGSWDQVHGTTTVPGSWGIGALAEAMALVSKVQAYGDHPHGTGIWVSGACCSDLGHGEGQGNSTGTGPGLMTAVVSWALGGRA